jgi:hypothetical protein
LTFGKIDACRQWILHVLDNRFELAQQSEVGYHVDYLGYPRQRFDNLKARFKELYGFEAHHMAFVDLQ